MKIELNIRLELWRKGSLFCEFIKFLKLRVGILFPGRWDDHRESHFTETFRQESDLHGRCRDS